VRRLGFVDLPTIMFFTSEGALVSRIENEFRDAPVDRILEGIEVARKRKKAIQENLARWREKYQADPANLEANQKLGWIYYSLKLRDKAIPFLDQAAELDPKAASKDGAWNLLAAAYLNVEKGEYAHARAQSEAFLAALPDHAEVAQMRYHLGVAFYHTHEDERARAEWRAILEKFPGSEWAAKAQKALALAPKGQ